MRGLVLRAAEPHEEARDRGPAVAGVDQELEAVEVRQVRGPDLDAPAKRGITRDYTSFLLILQGMSLQLEGIVLPPF